ncbi:hypothetical protein ACWEQC_40820 [Streptomyces shenzhenensis]
MDTLVAASGMTQRLADERDRIQVRIDDMVRTRDRLDELIALATDSAASSRPGRPSGGGSTPEG